VVAVLGIGVVPAETPILRADDLGTLRGDGIFETMLVRGGQAVLMDEHLDRLAVSASRLDLTPPARADLVELIRTAAGAWFSAGPAEEATLRLILTRGAELVPGPLTVFATVTGVPESVRRVRTDGVALLCASLGLPADVRRGAPWLLGGAKTLSYAVNMASQRWAQAAGADDVLWVSSDGYALEAPTATLVWLDGTTLCTVPVDATGILAGTTAAWLLAHAGELGWVATERMIAPSALAAADAAWLTSSVRGAVPIRTIDGSPIPQNPTATAAVAALLGFAPPRSP
jgi:4-amino-4-deoxychorismate lyase